jgi:hypothetical protein
MSDVTQILGAIQQGDPKAAGELLPLVYQELRRLAACKMANESPGQTRGAEFIPLHRPSSCRVRKNPVPVGSRESKRNKFRAPVAPEARAACRQNGSQVGFLV